MLLKNHLLWKAVSTGSELLIMEKGKMLYHSSLTFLCMTFVGEVAKVLGLLKIEKKTIVCQAAFDFEL